MRSRRYQTFFPTFTYAGPRRCDLQSASVAIATPRVTANDSGLTKLFSNSMHVPLQGQRLLLGRSQSLKGHFPGPMRSSHFVIPRTYRLDRLISKVRFPGSRVSLGLILPTICMTDVPMISKATAVRAKMVCSGCRLFLPQRNQCCHRFCLCPVQLFAVTRIPPYLSFTCHRFISFSRRPSRRPRRD